VALDLATELQHRLADCARSLSPVFGDLRRVRPEAIHLTLLFLGDTPAERLQPLTAALSTALAGQSPVPCSIKGLGVFPDLRRPLVLWAGVAAGGEALARLTAQVRDNLGKAGFGSDERPFAAHVTIARVRPRAGRIPPGAVEDALKCWSERPFGSLAGDHVTLYASTLTPAGPRYDALRIWPLMTPPEAL
jgi:2'-5' RNA ligase